MAGAEKRVIFVLVLVGVLAPAALAPVLVGAARERLIAPQRIAYLKHRPPAKIEVRALPNPAAASPAAGPVEVPRVFYARLPDDLDSLPPERRKEAFTAVVLPLVLRVNEMLGEDRRRLIDIRRRAAEGLPLRDWEVDWALNLAGHYRSDDPDSPSEIDWDLLLRRVDIIPPSLAIAQAANESGWGTSRFAREGNAIFGQWTWGDAPGMVPRQRPKGARHKVRRFEFLIESVLGYAHNLNTNPAYRAFRLERAARRARGSRPAGPPLAETLENYSERGADYVAEIRGMIEINGFGRLDQAQLMSQAELGAR